ncbi:hypothetical protein FH972_002544 [Carpinus fangiana]|uniref:Uncharacterized protein n=1 Tax=Carpinus fangiana TaxID=176857 RepID=A0A5N6QF71_9ROSI|nr:hypothetical protein FH972_002544 [Carpinus fangiana]
MVRRCIHCECPCHNTEAGGNNSRPFHNSRPSRPTNLSRSTTTAPKTRSWKAYYTRSSVRRPLCPSTPPQKKQKGCANYELLGTLFNDSTATGVLRHSSNEDPPNSEEEKELDDALLHFGMHVNATGNAIPLPSNQTHVQSSSVVMSTGGSKRMSIGKGSNSRLKKKEKEQQSSYMSDAFKEIAATACMKQDMLKAEAARTSMDTDGSTYFDPMTRCISILGEIAPDLDDDTYFKAVDEFKDNASLQMAFIKMPNQKRLGWLRRL